MKNFVLIIIPMLIMLLACNDGERETDSQNVAGDISNYEVASDRFSDLSDEAFDRMSSLDFDFWGEMLDEDVQYFFPDGDEGTRTVLYGKEDVLDWWKTWKDTTGIDRMTFSARVHIPVQANRELNYSGLTGVIVISYFSNEMIYNGQPVNIRTNVAAHYNEDSLIDRYYTYYDRTPILNTVNANALEIIVSRDTTQ